MATIVNPLTGRAVKVGSSTHKKLIRQQVLNFKDYIEHDDRVLYEFTERELMKPGFLEMKKKQLEEHLPATQQAVRGRGRYKNCLVVRDRQLTKKEYDHLHNVIAESKQGSDDEGSIQPIRESKELKEKKEKFRLKQEEQSVDDSLLQLEEMEEEEDSEDDWT